MLLENGCYEGAYYLLGYAVECGLKACIAKKTSRYDFPDKEFAIKVFTHRLADLLAAAGLKPSLDAERRINSSLDANWLTVTDWNEALRYEHTIAASMAQNMYFAVVTRKNGVLPWLKKHW